MSNFFLAINSYFSQNKFRTFGIIFSLFLLLSFFASKISFQENITDLIPSNSESETTSKVLKQVNFADKITIIISSEKSGTPDDLTDYANEFLSELNSKCEPYIGKIQGKIDEKDIKETFDFVYQNLPLFLEKADYVVIDKKINNDSIAKVVEANYKALISPTSIVTKDFILKDPLGISFIALKKLQQMSVGDNFELHNGFILTKDKKKLLLFVTPKLEANETDKNTIFIQELSEIRTELNSKFKRKVEMSYFGATPVAVANATQIKADVRNTSIFASVALILIFAFFYRSILTPIIIFIPSIFGAVFALAVLYFTNGTISAISLGISSILLGETTDYSIYVLTHLRNKKDLKLLYKDISKPLILCGATTAISFLCLIFVKSDALKDLGVFAALSVISTSIFSLILIPIFYKSKKQLSLSKENIIDKLGAYPYHKNKIIVGVLLILLVVGSFTYSKVTFNNDLSTLNFMPKELKKAQDELENIANKSSKSIYVATYGDSYEQVLEQNNLLFSDLEKEKSESKILNFSSIGGIVLSKEAQQQRIKEWNSFWTAQKKSQIQNELISNGGNLGFKPTTYSRFFQTLNTDFQRVSFQDYAKVESFFIDEFVAKRGDFFTISTLVQVPNEKRDAFVNDIKKQKNIVVIDRQQTNETFLGTLKVSFEKLVNYSFLAVFLILLVSFKRLEMVIVSIVPIILSWIFTAGMMGLFGLQFNIINIIVCTLIFGIGVDYSIFMTVALQKEHTFGKSELPTYKTSIFLSVTTTILGIGVLIFAKHPALHSIALIAVIGIFAALAITFVLQPLVFDFFVTNNVKKGNPPFKIRRFIHSILSFAYYGLGGLFLSILGLVFIKIAPMSKKKKSLTFHFVMSKFMHSVFLTYPAIKRKILNNSHEKFDKPAIIIANHTSFLDILAIGMLSPKIIFLVSDWVYNSPFFGIGVRLAGFYPVSSGIDNGIEHLREKVNQGFSLMVFPEGTRSVDNSVKRFHKGAFYLAEQFNLDIIPVVIHGYSEGSPKGDFMLYKSSTTVEILDRIKPNDDSFGQNFTEKTKKINAFFRGKYKELRSQNEGSTYFKSTLFNSFDFKESEIVKAVNADFNQNCEMYFELNNLIGSKAKILHFANDYGQLDVLLTLQESLRKIDSYIQDDHKRSCAKTNYFLKKRTIRYLDHLTEIDLSLYDVVLITDSNFSYKIDTYNGKVIILKNEAVLQNIRKLGFQIESEAGQLIVLTKI